MHSMSSDPAEIPPLSPLPPAIAERIGFLLGKSHNLLLARAKDLLEIPGFTLKHFGCLCVAASEGPLSQQRLGERIGLDRTTIVAIVDGLEEAGLVERRRDPDDRRAYALEVTRRGSAWLERVAVELRRVEDEFLTPLAPAERRILIELLQRLLVGEPTELVANSPVEVRPR